jgi:hypothetical protein
MNDIIEISNFLLINYWWIIIPICAVMGAVLHFVTDSYFNREIINKNLIDSEIKWDKYGNPVFGENDENNK